MKVFFISSALAFGILAWMQSPAANNTEESRGYNPKTAIKCIDTVPRTMRDSTPGNKKYPDTTRPRRDSIQHY